MKLLISSVELLQRKWLKLKSPSPSSSSSSSSTSSSSSSSTSGSPFSSFSCKRQPPVTSKLRPFQFRLSGEHKAVSSTGEVKDPTGTVKKKKKKNTRQTYTVTSDHSREALNYLQADFIHYYFQSVNTVTVLPFRWWQHLFRSPCPPPASSPSGPGLK